MLLPAQSIIKPLGIQVDLDGTLKTESWDNHYEDKVEVRGRFYRFKLRPHINSFFASISKLGDIYMNTSATSRYCRTFIKYMGISDFINGYIARDCLVLAHYYRKMILIDNDNDIMNQKINFLKKHTDKLIPILISTYRGDDGDKELLRLVDRIRAEL
jgi:hypothetical protein